MKENKNACPMKKTSIGGQALIEGIMMRGPKKTAMAVRNTKGEIVIEEWENNTDKKSVVSTLSKVPVVRGVINFVLSMKMGYKCLMRSAELSGLEELEEEERLKKEAKKAEKKAKKDAKRGIAPEAAEPAPSIEDAPTETFVPVAEEKKKNGDSVLMTVIGAISLVLGLGLAILLFVFLPSFLYELLGNVSDVFSQDNRYLKSAFEGILKVIILVAYMGLVSLMKDIRRTFMYHGAEHKTIFCYESGLELTVENVKKQQRFHPRCGTSFLIVMVIVGMLVSFLIPPSLPLALRVSIKLLLLPLIMGLGYEFIKFAGRHDNIIVKILSAPGLWFQRITVFEPTDDMIECAIEAVKKVIPEDNSDIL